MHLAILFSLILATPIEAQPGIYAEVSWRQGHCVLILTPGAALIQLQDPPLAGEISWPRTWPTVTGCRFARLNALLRIPFDPGMMHDVRQLNFPGISAGTGRRWALGSRVWWLAIPGGAWRVKEM